MLIFIIFLGKTQFLNMQKPDALFPISSSFYLPISTHAHILLIVFILCSSEKAC